MGGVGEVLAAAPGLPAFGIALVNPGAAVSTPAVFGARTAGFSPPACLPDRWRTAAEMADALGQLGNDLQAPALSLCPVIGAVLDWLRRRPAACWRR